MNTAGTRLAVIGGTGLDEMPELASGQLMDVTTHYGVSQVLRCAIEGQRFLFVLRHGLGHTTPPHAINYRAETAGLKDLGVEKVIGLCSVGSLTEELQPGAFAVLGDFIDLTRRGPVTFFDEREVVHTDFSRPYCPQVSEVLAQACRAEGVPHREHVVYVGVDGPRYETPAEVRLYASWGGQVVGMTNVPEAILAREAGICYGALAVVTNLAAGLSEGPLRHDDVRQAALTLRQPLMRLLAHSLRALESLPPCECCSADGRRIV